VATTPAHEIERVRPATANHRAVVPDAIVRFGSRGRTDEILNAFLEVSVDQPEPRGKRLQEFVRKLQEFVREPVEAVAPRVERVSTFFQFPPHQSSSKGLGESGGIGECVAYRDCS
jgi:hypothetical protein